MNITLTELKVNGFRMHSRDQEHWQLILESKNYSKKNWPAKNHLSWQTSYSKSYAGKDTLSWPALSVL